MASLSNEASAICGLLSPIVMAFIPYFDCLLPFYKVGTISGDCWKFEFSLLIGCKTETVATEFTIAVKKTLWS
jgi:hypothetical protein